MATKEIKLEESPLFLAVLHDASELYGRQPYKKNALGAVIVALDKHGIRNDPLQSEMRALVCSKLGKSGSDKAFFNRHQLDLFPTK